MEKGEREVGEREGRGGRRGREREKGEMGVGPTKFGRKSTPLALSIFQVTVSRVKWLHCSN